MAVASFPPLVHHFYDKEKAHLSRIHQKIILRLLKLPKGLGASQTLLPSTLMEKFNFSAAFSASDTP